MIEYQILSIRSRRATKFSMTVSYQPQTVSGRANYAVRDTATAALDVRAFGTLMESASLVARKSGLGSAAFDVDEFLRRSVAVFCSTMSLVRDRDLWCLC